MRAGLGPGRRDPGIRVCVLTGAGGAFCAGADLKAMTSDHPGSRLGDFDLSVIEPLLKGRRLTKPLIAAVEGPAIAGGTEILQACDIRVAGESARFGVSEARWGLFPLGGSAVRLPRQIPYTLAADLLLTGRHITGGGGAVDRADRPRRAGRPGPGQGAGDRRRDRRQRPGRGARDPAAIRETEGMAENDAFAIEAKLGMAVFASEDAREGPRAFAEKRRPEFRTADGGESPGPLVRWSLIAAGPVRVAQPPLVELAVGVAREFGDVVDGPRQLELGDPAVEEGQQLRGQLGAGLGAGAGCTTALISSPQSSCGMPNTATSSTAGWQDSSDSISAG